MFSRKRPQNVSENFQICKCHLFICKTRKAHLGPQVKGDQTLTKKRKVALRGDVACSARLSRQHSPPGVTLLHRKNTREEELPLRSQGQVCGGGWDGIQHYVDYSLQAILTKTLRYLCLRGHASLRHTSHRLSLKRPRN